MCSCKKEGERRFCSVFTSADKVFPFSCIPCAKFHGFIYKEGISPNGTEYKYMGYENFALLLALNNEVDESIIINQQDMNPPKPSRLMEKSIKTPRTS